MTTQSCLNFNDREKLRLLLLRHRLIIFDICCEDTDRIDELNWQVHEDRLNRLLHETAN